jgi:uncharacterized SAM-binding protein YcdF (DUF218 family)
VIVVLGAALRPDGSLSAHLADRVEGGVRAFHERRADKMVMTGAYEAGAMREHAVARGVPREAILLEERATTTRENAVGCAALMRERGLTRALIVTQPYHMWRSLLAFRRAGVAAAPVWIPESAPLRQKLRELVALAAYGVRGWL